MMKLYVNFYTILVVTSMLWSGQNILIFAHLKAFKVRISCLEPNYTIETIKITFIWVFYVPISHFLVAWFDIFHDCSSVYKTLWVDMAIKVNKYKGDVKAAGVQPKKSKSSSHSLIHPNPVKKKKIE